MAKILVVYFSESAEVIYDQICSMLVLNGNNVLRININNKKFKINGFVGNSEIICESLKMQLREFSPDIVFDFNHACPMKIKENLSADCKICILDADNPEFFWNKNQLDDMKHTYYYLGFQSDSKKLYTDFLKLKMNSKNYLYFPSATSLKTENLEKKYNISFIGTNFLPSEIPFQKEFYSDNAIKLFLILKKNYYSSACQAIDISFTNHIFRLVKHFYVGQDRLKYLQSLEGLGLTIFGDSQWKKLAYYDFDLIACYNEKPIKSLKDNSYVYNSSKISVNISHPQATSAFSWRVADIMASSSCLLMEYKKDWDDLFGKYISENVKSLIIYKDRFDMRNKAIKLLDDESLRIQCIKELNYAISQNGRWEHRFKILEAFLGIKLLSVSNNNPFYLQILQDKNKNKDMIANKYIQFLKKYRNKLYYKLWKHLNKKLKRKGMIE